jgi:rSAM/selenodomain-associated transferase 2
VAALLQGIAGSGIERIVVDGGSRDGTADAARAAGAEQVLRSAPGRARQLDVGFRAAHGQVVLFLHADTRLEPGWAEALRRALDDPAVAGGAFRLRFDSRSPALRWVEFWAHVRCRLAGLPYGDQGLFVRRQVLEDAGGIAPVPIFEDLDLARSIRRAGRLVLLPQRALTSARRYERHGVGRLVLRNSLALVAFWLGMDRERVARWYHGWRTE